MSRPKLASVCRAVLVFEKWKTVLFLCGLLGLSACGSKKQEELAVADSFGEIRAYLVSGNYEGAYKMMSSDFKSARTIQNFQAMDEHGAMTRGFTNCNWSMGGHVSLNGTQAVVEIQYNPSFGTSFKFVKEGGYWRFTGETSGFEKLDL